MKKVYLSQSIEKIIRMVIHALSFSICFYVGYDLLKIFFSIFVLPDYLAFVSTDLVFLCILCFLCFIFAFRYDPFFHRSHLDALEEELKLLENELKLKIVENKALLSTKKHD